MRQVPNGKRPRNRPGRNNRQSNPRNQTFDSSGPEGKVRGTANQVYEKYLALGRDAQSSGDRIAAENFFQHAEHYFRILSANGQQTRPRSMNGFGGEFEDDDTEHSATTSERGESQPRQLQRSEQPAEQPSGQPSSQQNARTSDEAPPQGRRETPAELANAAAANADQRPQQRGRRATRRSTSANSGAEATS